MSKNKKHRPLFKMVVTPESIFILKPRIRWSLVVFLLIAFILLVIALYIFSPISWVTITNIGIAILLALLGWWLGRLPLRSELSQDLKKEIDLINNYVQLIKETRNRKIALESDYLKSSINRSELENWRMRLDSVIADARAAILDSLSALPLEDKETLLQELGIDSEVNLGSDFESNKRDESTKSNLSGSSNQHGIDLKFSVAYPKFLSKRFESTFLFQIYLSTKRNLALKNIRYEFKDQAINEYAYKSSVIFGQTVKVRFSSPEFVFSDMAVKLIERPVNKIVFLGKPLDSCMPGLHKILVSVSDVETDQEFESFTITVRVVDFAFDHVSRPLISRVSAAILGIGSFAMFALTFLEQIDKTIGLTSGTAAGVLAAVTYANFYNLYQRIRPNTP